MRVIVVLATTMLASGCTLEPAEAPSQVPSTATADEFRAKARAIDGDTVAADFRLLGVDALERKQQCERNGRCEPCGKTAQDVAARLLKDGNAVITLTGAMTYGRPVAAVRIGGKDLGEEMIAKGLAIPVEQYLKKDPERAAAYQRASETATASRAGMHAGRWIAPAAWRRGERLSCEKAS
jgi:micrococcal nuclease